MNHRKLTEKEVKELKYIYSDSNREGKLEPPHADGYACIGHMYDFGFESEKEEGTHWRTWVFYKPDDNKNSYTTVGLHDDGNQWASISYLDVINDNIDNFINKQQ